jgi:osmotically-inducible protein OsmY
MKVLNKPFIFFIFVVLTASMFGCAATATHEGTGGYVDDSAITTKVKSELLATKGVDSTEITVETFKGVVKLSGFIDNKDMIDTAIRTAQAVAGVKSVTNDMTIKGQQGGR